MAGSPIQAFMAAVTAVKGVETVTNAAANPEGALKGAAEFGLAMALANAGKSLGKTSLTPNVATDFRAAFKASQNS